MIKTQLNEWIAVAAMLAITGFFWMLTPGEGEGGSTIFPNVVMGMMLLLALIKIATLLLVRLPEAVKTEAAEADPETAPTKWRFWFVLGASLVYIAAVDYIGFFVSSFFFFFGVTLAIQTEKRTPRSTAIRAAIVVGFLLFLWALFTKVLMAQLPKGFLF